MHDGTRTAGLTAPSVKPSAKARAHGSLKIQRQARADAAASAFYGQSVKSTTVSPLPLKSSSMPPLSKIIERQIERTHPAHGSG